MTIVLACWLGAGSLGLSAAAGTAPADSETLVVDMLASAERAYREGDYARAFDLTRTVAESGNAQAQFNLGVLYSKGHGTPRNYPQATLWYLKAADQGHRAAMLNLSVILEKGLGGKRDLQFAADLRRLAGKTKESNSATQPLAMKPAPLLEPAPASASAPPGVRTRPAFAHWILWVSGTLAGAMAVRLLYRSLKRARDLQKLTLPQRFDLAKRLSDSGENSEATRLLLNQAILAEISSSEASIHETIHIIERAGRLQDLIDLLIHAPSDVSTPFAKALIWVGKTSGCARLLKARPSLTPDEDRLLAIADAPASAPAAPPPPAKALLGGKYEVRRMVGEGGMGIVYEGYEPHLDRKVAIKKMRREIRADPRVRQHFSTEARMIAKVRHPYIVAIHDLLDEGGELYLILDFVEGKTLSDMLIERERFPMTECKELLRYVCEAVEFAHGKKVLHRDLKPANIIVNQEGFAMVMDFGLAREAKETIARATSNDISGSPAYMAPEAHLGQATAASDVYSIAAMLYEMLTGSIPFRGPDYLSQKERSLYTPLSQAGKGISQACDELLARALDPDPKKRIASPSEFFTQLTRI